MPPPSQVDVVFATDEDVAATAGADYQVIASRWFKFAYGTDGIFANGLPWTLNSGSVPFAAQGVATNMIAQLQSPKGLGGFAGSGDLLAIETVAANAITLRRIGEAAGVGQPPAPIGGLTGVTFLVTSLRKQLEDVSYELYERFAIDPALAPRTPGDIYNQRVLRRPTIYKLLFNRYLDLHRAKEGDFADKIKQYGELFRDSLNTATLKWGPTGDSQDETSIFSARVTR